MFEVCKDWLSVGGDPLLVVEPFASRSEMANGNKTGFPFHFHRTKKIRRTGRIFFCGGGAGNRTRVLR